MEDLPELCITHILSYTSTPVDACKFSLVSKAFRSAAESDLVWDRFFPSDLSSIVSPSSFPSSYSKKALYFALSDCPTIIDQGRKSFQLEKLTGNKCYMLSARDLSVIWGDTSQYWEWTTLPESRFQEVAALRAVCWFDISGRINALALSSNNHYAAFLVFKMIDARGFHFDPVVLSVGILGGNSSTKNVCLDPNLEDNELDERFRGLQRPYLRRDGWLEIEMGGFFNSGLEEDEVQMRVAETTSNWWKSGFVLEGIEVRPKHV
ncbi:F-box protein PP2-B10 [Spatholobus suberectus]|nr:F-box protein PP2-B10 [Spatholobus suberectus]